MTTRLHLSGEEARSLLAFPMSILAWLETTALKLELAPFIKRSRGEDAWYLSRGDGAFGPIPIARVVRMLLRGEGPFSILRASEAEVDPAPWHPLNYHPWPLGRGAAIAWIAGFWLLAAAAGFAVVGLAVPVGIRTIAEAAYAVAFVGAAAWVGLDARRGAAPPPETDGEAEAAPEAEPE